MGRFSPMSSKNSLFRCSLAKKLLSIALLTTAWVSAKKDDKLENMGFAGLIAFTNNDQGYPVSHKDANLQYAVYFAMWKSAVQETDTEVKADSEYPVGGGEGDYKEATKEDKFI